MGSSERRIKPWAAAIMLALAGLALLVPPAWTEDLGRVGPIYPVAEPDLLELIQSRLQQKQQSGELARIERDSRDRSRRSIESPQPVAGLVRTHTPRTYHFDPSITVPETLRDHEGKVLVAAGTRVNPLDFVSLSNHLIFFDARDSAQAQQALALRRHYQGRAHLILTGGSYIDFMKRFDVRVYFDQQGLLVRRLGIRQVPALVTQEGKRLRIDELKVGS